MSQSWIQRRTTRLQQRWTDAERRRRAEVARRRCAALLARFAMPATDDNLAVWAGGAMSLSDVARIAG